MLSLPFLKKACACIICLFQGPLRSQPTWMLRLNQMENVLWLSSLMASEPLGRCTLYLNTAEPFTHSYLSL